MKTNLCKAPKNNPLIKAKNRRYMVKMLGHIFTAVMVVCMMAAMSITAFAADPPTNDAASFNTVVKFIVTWVQRIGYVIGFVGAVMFGLAFKNDDADGKQRGLMTLASGFIVVAICLAYDQLFASAV